MDSIECQKLEDVSNFCYFTQPLQKIIVFWQVDTFGQTMSSTDLVVIYVGHMMTRPKDYQRAS